MANVCQEPVESDQEECTSWKLIPLSLPVVVYPAEIPENDPRRATYLAKRQAALNEEGAATLPDEETLLREREEDTRAKPSQEHITDHKPTGCENVCEEHTHQKNSTI